jgi:ribonuclease inhibitor
MEINTEKKKMDIVIDGTMIKTEADFHSALAEKLSLSSYYGRNLDALWDVLSADVERPVCLVWKNSRISSESLGPKFDQIISLLERIKKQDEVWKLSEKFDFRLD